MDLSDWGADGLVTPHQLLRSYRGGDHDDDDGWLYLCVTPHQHLRPYTEAVIMMMTMVGCVIALTPRQHLRLYISDDHDDDDGWFYYYLTPQQHLKSYRGGDHEPEQPKP